MGVIVDGTARDVVGVEKVEPMAPRFPAHDRLDLRRERLTVAHACGVIGEFRRVGPLRVAQHIAQPAEQPVVGGAKRDEAVGASNGLIGRIHAVRRSERRRQARS